MMAIDTQVEYQVMSPEDIEDAAWKRGMTVTQYCAWVISCMDAPRVIDFW